MNGRDLLFNLKEECFKIGHHTKIKENYKIFQESLSDFNVLNYFFQISKNTSGTSTFELCFLDGKFVHDITIAPESSTHSIVDITSISKLAIVTDSETGIFDFNIHGNSDGIFLMYSLDQSRFEEINKFKNELLKIIMDRRISI